MIPLRSVNLLVYCFLYILVWLRLRMNELLSMDVLLSASFDRSQVATENMKMCIDVAKRHHHPIAIWILMNFHRRISTNWFLRSDLHAFCSCRNIVIFLWDFFFLHPIVHIRMLCRCWSLRGQYNICGCFGWADVHFKAINRLLLGLILIIHTYVSIWWILHAIIRSSRGLFCMNSSSNRIHISLCCIWIKIDSCRQCDCIKAVKPQPVFVRHKQKPFSINQQKKQSSERIYVKTNSTSITGNLRTLLHLNHLDKVLSATFRNVNSSSANPLTPTYLDVFPPSNFHKNE